jgi:hypothetical protein
LQSRQEPSIEEDVQIKLKHKETMPVEKGDSFIKIRQEPTPLTVDADLNQQFIEEAVDASETIAVT